MKMTFDENVAVKIRDRRWVMAFLRETGKLCLGALPWSRSKLCRLVG